MNDRNCSSPTAETISRRPRAAGLTAKPTRCGARQCDPNLPPASPREAASPVLESSPGRRTSAGALACIAVLYFCAAAVASPASADNKRLNNSVIANVYTIQHQHGCTNDVSNNLQLQLAAQWHTDDVMGNGTLDSDLGSDGSNTQDRANAAGYHGAVAETVAINPSLAINNLDILNQWYYRPDYMAIMSNCAYRQMGVWSANSFNRSVVVAVYGNPRT